MTVADIAKIFVPLDSYFQEDANVYILGVTQISQELKFLAES
ncbi:hypothetical protein [Pseudanabaena cinerea]|jgi:hypothetical protein|nr:hypothetical protein [Pseudanabaena cinerea]